MSLDYMLTHASSISCILPRGKPRGILSIKEDKESVSQSTIPRKYFSGGVKLDFAMQGTNLTANNIFTFTDGFDVAGSVKDGSKRYEVKVALDAAMSADIRWEDENIKESLNNILKIGDDEKNTKLKAKVDKIALIMSKTTSARYAVMRKIIEDFVNVYGINFEKLKPSTKGQLFTIVQKISGQSTYDVWRRFIDEISEQFGIDIRVIDDDEKQKILTAALYVSLGKKINKDGKDVSIKEETFKGTIENIKGTFGISEDELKKKKADGGLELTEKIRLITAAYAKVMDFNSIDPDFAMTTNILQGMDFTNVSETIIFAENVALPQLNSKEQKNVDNQNLGGIDLTRVNMNLQTKKLNGEILFHPDAAMLLKLQNAPGFTIGSITIQPLKNLPEFLGADVTVPTHI